MGAFDDLVAPKSAGAFDDLVPAASISKADKVLRGIKDPIDGAAQLLYNALPTSVQDAGNSFNNWLAEKTGLVDKVQERGLGGKTGVDKQVSDDEAAYQAKRAAAGESGIDGYRLLGNVVSPANLAVGARTATLLPKAGALTNAALSGSATSLLNPVADGNYWDEKAMQGVMGAAGGAATRAVTGAAARLISPNASVNPKLDLLRSEGVKPTIGQTLGGAANTLEERAQSLPILGDAIAAARGRAREQFNSAAINRATAPIGEKVEGVGTQAVQDAGDAISKMYDAGKAALGGFKIDQQANSELSNLRMLATSGLQGRERATVNKYFSDYLQRPSLTAESFKELDSKLASDIAKFGSGDAYQQKVADALKEVKSIINQNALRANPQAAEMIAKADKAWANLVRVEGASMAAKGTEGVFAPGQLLTAVRGADKSVRDRATARGTALMQDLASAGQSVLGNKVPDSGTAGRMFLGAGALGGGYAIDPLVPVGLLGGAAMYSAPVQSLLRGAVASRPNIAKPVANAVRQSSPYLAPVGTNRLLGLL